MGGDRAFFQIAAALLPALMFGALLTDRLRPPATIGRHYGRVVFGVVVGATFLLFAETVAIKAAITGEPTSFERVLVALAVMIASGGTVAMALYPWIAKLPHGERAVHIVGAVALVTVVAVGSVRMLDSAVRFSTSEEKIDEINALYRQDNALERRRTAAMRELANLSERRDKLLRQGGPRNRARARTLKYLFDLQVRDLERIQNEQELLSERMKEAAEALA